MNILTPEPQYTDEQRVQQSMERYRVSADFDRPFKDRHNTAWRNLHGVLPMVWPFWSRHFEPETQINTTETVERILGNLLPKENFFGLKPMHGQPEITAAKLRELMNYDLRKKARFKLSKCRQVQEGVSYGNAVVFHYVDMEVRCNCSRQPIVDEFGIQQGYQEVQDKTVEFWSKERNISSFDCYPATTGADIEEMPYFIHRELVPINVLKRGMWDGVLRNVGEITPFLSIDAGSGRAGLDNEDLAFDLYERLRAVGLNVKEGIQTGTPGGAVQYVELLYETMAPAESGGCPHRRIIANRKLLIFDDDLPAWHRRKGYSEIKYLERSAQLWRAAGLPELMEPQQLKINLRSNQASDGIALNNNPTRLLSKNAGVEDVTLLDNWPGRVIEVNGDASTAVVELVRPHVGNDLFTDLDLTRAGIQRMSKLYDATRNLTGARTGMGAASKTATGARIVSDMMNSAVNFKMLLFEEQGLLEGLRIHLSLLQQICTREQRLRVEDATNPVFANSGEVMDGFITINPEEVQGEYDVELTGPTNTLEDPERAQLVATWMQTGLQDPELRQYIKTLDGWLYVGEKLGVTQPRQFVLSPQEIQQRQLAAAQQGPQPNVKVIETMAYKDMPSDIQRQMEAAAGFQPSQIGGASNLEKSLVTAATKPEPKPNGPPERNLR